MFCADCGREIPENNAFCPSCGAAVRTSPAAGAPLSPPTAGLTPSREGTTRGIPEGSYSAPPVAQDHVASFSPQGQTTAAPHVGPSGAALPLYAKKRSALPWVLGGLGMLVVTALVLVLVFVVLGGKDAAATSPEDAVRGFFRALEKEDTEMLLGVMEPSFREELKRTLGSHRDTFFELFFSVIPDDLQVDIRKMTTDLRGDEATVTVIDGTMTYTDESGERVSEEASEAEESSFEVVRVGEKWYISGDYLAEAGLDPEGLDYLDMLDETGAEEGGSLDGSGELTGEKELAAAEEAMLEYVRDNAAAGREYAITGLLLNGDEAVGIAMCLDAESEKVPVVMARDAYGWYGVSLGTGTELPDWFLAEIVEVEEVMLDFAYLNSTGEMTLEIINLAIRGDQAVAVVTSIDQEVELAAITAKKGSRGWYVVDFGTGIELPEWYWPQAYW